MILAIVVLGVLSKGDHWSIERTVTLENREEEILLTDVDRLDMRVVSASSREAEIEVLSVLKETRVGADVMPPTPGVVPEQYKLHLDATGPAAAGKEPGDRLERMLRRLEFSPLYLGPDYPTDRTVSWGTTKSAATVRIEFLARRKDEADVRLTYDEKAFEGLHATGTATISIPSGELKQAHYNSRDTPIPGSTYRAELTVDEREAP